jgi:DNA-binding IclR family transcriptional regulator
MYGLTGMNDRYNIPNLEKAMRVLEHLAGHPEGRSVRELVEDLGIPKTGIYRIVTTLTNLEYLVGEKNNGKYRLTRKLLALGNSAICSENILEHALDEMYDLRDECTETVQLNTIVGHQGVILEFIPALHPIRLMIDPGTRFELHASAPGKALLAYLPPTESDHIMQAMEFQKFQKNTISSKAAFRKELSKVRKCGYSIDRGESVVAGAMCVSAPIFDRRNYPVAALTITAPSLRMSEKDFPRFAKMVIPRAKRISRRLGQVHV